MSNSLRQPNKIDSLNELEVAKKKAAINATEDKLRLQRNLTHLGTDGKDFVLKQLILPVVGVGVAVYGVSKLVGALSRSDASNSAQYSNYASDPIQPVGYHPNDARSHEVRSHGAGRQASGKGFEWSSLVKYAPVAIQVARYGVGYLERNGTQIPPIVHQLLAGPKGKSAAAVNAEVRHN